jgi:hypothetical protein
MAGQKQFRKDVSYQKITWQRAEKILIIILTSGILEV